MSRNARARRRRLQGRAQVPAALYNNGDGDGDADRDGADNPLGAGGGPRVQQENHPGVLQGGGGGLQHGFVGRGARWVQPDGNHPGGLQGGGAGMHHGVVGRGARLVQPDGNHPGGLQGGVGEHAVDFHGVDGIAVGCIRLDGNPLGVSGEVQQDPLGVGGVGGGGVHPLAFLLGVGGVGGGGVHPLAFLLGVCGDIPPALSESESDSSEDEDPSSDESDSIFSDLDLDSDDDVGAQSSSRTTGRMGRARYKKFNPCSESTYGVQPQPMYQEAKAMFDELKSYEKLIRVKKRADRLPRQRTIDDIPVLRVNYELLPEHLEELYKNSDEFLLSYFKLYIDVTLENGQVVRILVTPQKEPTREKRTHHIIAMVRPDEAQAEILFENYSMYAVAGRVVHKGEDRALVKWALWGDEPLATSRFKFWKTRYNTKYDKNIGKIYLVPGVGGKLFDFIKSLMGAENQEPSSACQPADGDACLIADGDASMTADGEASLIACGDSDILAARGEGVAPEGRTTVEGKKRLATIFALFSEVRRFWGLRVWVREGGGLFPKEYPDIVQDWLALCKGVLLLYLHLLEKALSTNTNLLSSENERMVLLSEKSKADALEWWDTCQSNLISTGLVFYKERFVDPSDKSKGLVIPDLWQLAPGVVTLIKNDDKLWDLITLRWLCYCGYWLREILARAS